MVRRLGLALAFLCLPSLALATDAPAPLSPAAEALPSLPARPAPLQRVPNVGWEDFVAVTLVSLPFTAFWSLLGALAVGGIAQGKFPPEIDAPLLAGAATAAGGASLAIGLVSVSWGPGKAPSAPAPLSPSAKP